MRSTEIAVIGSGLTGLVTAFWLRRKGLRVTVFEKNKKTGGVIKTCHEDGFTYETGPNTGVLTHPEVAELFAELAGACHIEPADEKAKKRLIWKNGSWHPLPSGLAEAVSTPLFTPADKLRILLEPFRKKGKDPFESLESMVKRRLGQSFLDYAVDPFISGIYAGNPAYLVPRFALPKLYALEQRYGSFIVGALIKMFAKKSESERAATREVFSVRGGLGNLVGALESDAGESEILCSVSDLIVTPFNNGYIIKGYRENEEITFQPKVVVTTTGPHEFKYLLPFLHKDELSVLDNLLYAGVIQITMGFRKWRGMDLNAFGGLVPSCEKRDILGILFPSSFLKNRAPEGGALLSVFLGGARNPGMILLPDNEIITKAIKEVQIMLGITDCSPGLLKISRFSHAIPQYGKSTMQRLEAIAAIHSKYKGLILAGNIHEGIGMSDRIRQGKRLAEHIAKAF